MKNSRYCLALLLSILTPLVFAQAPAQGPLADCDDRQCLINLVDDYFDALVAHDPSGLPLANDVYFVENVYKKPIGDGLWQTATQAPTTFKIYVPDTVSKQVGFMGIMEVSGGQVLIALRLRIINGRIGEVEHLYAGNLSPDNMTRLQVARPAFSEAVPARQQMERYEILGVAYSYYDALNFNNGDLSPMADDCARRENGSLASNSGLSDDETDESPNYSKLQCVDQFNTNMMAYISDLDNVRVPIVDKENGLAMGFSHFRHNGELRSFPIYNMPGVETREVNYGTFDLPAAHVYKITDGEIHEIEAMGFAAPFMAPTGWVD